MIKKFNSFPYETLLDLVSDGIIILHRTKIIACNDILLGWLGYTYEELVGLELSEILEPEDYFLIQELENRYKNQTSSVFPRTISLLHKDQKNKISAKTNIGFPTQETWSDHCIVTLNNVTREKMFQKLLDSSQQHLQEVIETFPDIYYVTDGKGILTKVSPSVKEILGYEPQEVLGTPMIKYYQKPELRSALMAQVVAAKGKYVAIEGALLHKSGRPVWFNTRARILIDASGNITGLEGLARDSTAEKNAQEMIENNEKNLLKIKNNLEEKVREQTQELLQKERLWFQQSRHAQMGEMISAIAHQWRQPLFALSLWIDNISTLAENEKLQKEDLRNFSEKAHDLIQSMSKTIDEFKNFFKPRPETEIFNLSQAVAGATDLIKSSLIQENINLELHNVENVCIQGYQNEFGQVIINLLTNAKESLLERKAPNPTIMIRLSLENQNVIIEVSDNAGGIPPEIIDKIFDPYFTTKKLGTGIGLYMSKSIIEKNMNGQISVTNGASGALFKITMPYKLSSDCPKCSAGIPSRCSTEEPTNKKEQKNLDHLRIIFVDDSDDTREVFQLMLKKNGATVKTAASSKECLQIISEFKPDLIISDISMPEEDGFSLIKKIRTLKGNTKNIPAIALSAHIDEDQIQQAYDVGFQRYIKKPVNWKTLTNVILELLESSTNNLKKNK